MDRSLQLGGLEGEVDRTVWVDQAWLDTVVVAGLTAFVLCLMGLSKVSGAGGIGTFVLYDLSHS